MKRKHTLRSLLSMVCTIAMIISMVPVLPAAAAEDDLLFDNMESYTVGTDVYTQAPDKYTQKSPSWNAVKDAGGSATVVADPTNSKNKVIAMTTVGGDSKRYVFATAPELNGDYTLQFDYMPGDAEGNPNSGFIDIYINSGNAHMARIGSALYNTYFNLDKTGCSNVIKNAELDLQNQWYSVRIVVTAGQYVMEIWEKGDEDTKLTATTTKGTKAVSKAHVEFCIGPYLESQGVANTADPITNYIDNIRITPGVVEAEDPSDVGTGDVAVSGGGMIEFVDEYIIENKDAVAVTAGMGIFSGKDGNRFDPMGQLTRAEMATVIVKMLRGNAFNADNFKGIDTFTDTADYQGGWAEGYINACVQLGIVSGYGDGTFKPGNPVTTAEALTMIINALKVDAGEGQWPATIMAKAQEMKLYGDLAVKPGTYDPLTRDQLAVLVYEGMCYSPSGVTGWKVPGNDIIFSSYADAQKFGNPVEVKGEDSLVSKIYEMQIVEGYIVENQDTSDNKYTTIQSVEMNGDLGDEFDFNMNTRLDQIGHYVTVYYRETWNGDRDPGVVYNYVDKTETIVVEKDITNSKDYKEVFYEKYAAAEDVALFDGNYDFEDYASIGGIYTAGSAADAGTYFVYEGEIVGYMDPIPVYVAKVEAVNDFDGSETIRLSGVPEDIENNEDNDRVREYKGIAKDDYVVYTKVGSGDDAIYVLTLAVEVKGMVSKQTTNKDGDSVVTINGVEFVQFAGSNDNEINNIDKFNEDDNRTIAFGDVDWSGTYVLYITEDGKYFGFEQSEGAMNISQTVFILGQVHIDTEDKYSQAIRKTYARGVDMSGNEVMLLVSVQKNGEVDGGLFFPSANEADNIWDRSYEEEFNFALTPNTFYTYELSNDAKAKKEDIYKLKAYPTAYDEETAPIYSATGHVAANGTVGFNGYKFGNPSMLTYTSSGLIFMTLEGELNQDEPLVGTLQKVWATSANTTGAQMQRYFLLSRGEDGNQLMEAAVIISEDLKSNKTVVYISEENLESEGTTANGITYTVHDYQAGTKKEITLSTKSAQFDSAGYWHLVPEEDTTNYIIEGKVVDSPAFNYNVTQNATNDELYNENILHDQVMCSLINNQLSTAYVSAPGTEIMTRGQKASSGVVLDTRSEDQIKSDGIGKITSLDRINSLAMSNPEISVVFDLCYSVQSDKMLTVFIKDVNFAATEDTTITQSGDTYRVDGREVADDATITDTTGRLGEDAEVADLVDMMDEGYTVDFTYEVSNGKITAITVTNILGQGELFYEGFDQYEVGDDYVLGSNSLLVQGTNYAGNVTTKVVNEGELTLKASGGAGNRAVVATNVSFTGNYVAEARFKVDSSSSNIGMFYLSKITYNRIKSGESEVTQTRHDMRLNTDGTIHFEVNRAQDDNKLTGATVDTANKLYMYTGGTENDTAVGSTVSFADDTWYIVKKYVNSAAKTVTTELWNGAGTEKLGSRTLHAGVINATTFDVEAFYDATIILDYIKVIETESDEIEIYEVTAPAAANGLINVSKKTATEGETITVTTTAKTGYKLSSLKVNGGVNLVDGTDLAREITTTITMPDADATITAEFVKINYAKVTVANPAEGTVTVTGADDLNNVIEGTVLTIAAAATDADRYALKGIKVNGDALEEEDGAYTYTVLATDEELVITAEFDTLYTVTVGDVENGTVTVDKEGAVAGATVTVTADPDDYYKFKAITVKDSQNNPVGVNEDGEFVMPADDVTVTAEFERMTYTLTTKVNDADFGTVSAGGTKEAGETTITLTPETGYVAKYVLVNGVKKELTGTDSYKLVVADETATTVAAVFWPEGAAFHEDFGAYAVGTDYTKTMVVKQNMATGATAKVAEEDGDAVLKVDAAARGWLKTNVTFTGDFVVEGRFKGAVNDDAGTKGTFISPLRIRNGVKVAKSTSNDNANNASGQYTDYELRITQKNIIDGRNMFLVVNKSGGDNYFQSEKDFYANSTDSTAKSLSRWELPLYKSGTSGDVAKFTEDTWYTIKVTTNKAAKTMLTELFDDSGNLLGARTLYHVEIDYNDVATDVTMDANGSAASHAEIYWDYITVYQD